MADIISLVDELSKLSKEKDSIKEKYDKVEAEILTLGGDKLKDSKEKSISYVGTGANKVTFTKSETLKLLFPSRLKEIFGVVYGDVVEEKTSYTVNTEGKKILTNMWLKHYINDSSIESLVKSLEVDDKTEKALLKKLKGKNPETDKKTLMKFAGLDEEKATENAYLVSEIVAWQNFMMIVKSNETKENPIDIEELLKNIDGAVMVVEGIKLTVE